MDSLTQVVLGAAVGEVALGKKVGNKAMLWGAIAGTIPDLDVIGRLFLDDITAQEVHRGFTHSLLFSLVMAPLFGWLLAKLYRKKGEASWGDWSKLMFWSFVTHPLLDCHTTWGTQFFWPFDLRIAYNNINVVDPIYTVPFLLLVFAAMFFKRTSPIRKTLVVWGLILSSSYMLVTVAAKFYTKSIFEKSLAVQGYDYQRFSNKPTIGNSILWTANVESEDSMYIGYYSLMDSDRNIRFTGHPKHHERIEGIKNEDQIARLLKLTKDWYVVQMEGKKLVICDMRFGEMTEGSGAFVFSNYVEKYDNQHVIVRKEPEFDSSTMRQFLSMLWARIRGDKDALILQGQ